MMNRADEIKKAEVRYVPLLESFFMKIWGSTFLWSHDINHHRRVWNYARELLLSTGIPDILAEKLLIASYLHDLGMVHDKGEKHGHSSREFCLEFLQENSLNTVAYSDVLNAIEHHDDKEYKNHDPDRTLLLKLLSAADDLDAFGFIGIYRYFEIYLARGVNNESIGIRIKNNSSGRFAMFESDFSAYPDLVKKHKKRFLILDDFITSYNKTNEKSGIIRLISDMNSLMISPAEAGSLAFRYKEDILASLLLEGLRMELNI